MILTLLAASTWTLMGLSELPTQKEAPNTCRSFLWLKTDPPARIAMIDEKQNILRLQKGNQTLDLPASGPNRYQSEGYAITLDLHYESSRHISQGAVIDNGVMRMEPLDGQSDSATYSVGGMRACQ